MEEMMRVFASFRRPSLNGSALVALLSLSASFAQAAPQDYEGKIPENLQEMRRVDQKMVDGALGAFFDGPVGRASLWIWPAPAGEPGSIWSNPDTKLQGDTPGAKRMLMQMVDRNLEHGTKALGENYQMTSLTFDTMTAGDISATCASTDRAQDPAQVKPKDQQLFLRERLCAIQNGEDVLTLSTTRPYMKGSEEEARAALIAFTGEMLFTLAEQPLSKPAP